MSKVKPIKPEDVSSYKQEILPDEVIKSFNDLIAQNWNGSYAKFKAQEANELICSRLNIDSSKCLGNRYLDIEDIYRANGWEVHYDSPGYNESYDSTFQFRKK